MSIAKVGTVGRPPARGREKSAGKGFLFDGVISQRRYLHRQSRSPRVSDHALSGVAGGYAGELALECGGGGPAVQPFLLGGGGDEGSIVRLRRAVDDEGCARERLERRTDKPVGAEIWRPRRASPPGHSAGGRARGEVRAEGH